MITSNNYSSQEKKTKNKRNNQTKTTKSFNKKRQNFPAAWSVADQELLGWFYSYLSDNPGTAKNPYYKVIIERIQRGPYVYKGEYGGVQNELRMMRALLEGNLKEVYAVSDYLN